MAYMVGIGFCHNQPCTKPAEQRVYNWSNRYVGHFCLKCAQNRVRDLRVAEEREKVPRRRATDVL